ncbi:S8 family serine peptidase [Fulvivirgaceae bacterium BMA12]|uniref:S8 family serine peptidase n=1 Tax=Agaribacillus aureus TaxID=3051825 RepID=A0ABT8L7K9_9BACT|nr:S8 family serine peptidase [Fulvivirgaceae bacterium BMA12]
MSTNLTENVISIPSTLIRKSFRDYPNSELLGQNLDQGLIDREIPSVWNFSQGKGVKIAILDTGVALNHPDLRGNIAKVKNFTKSIVGVYDIDGHGTHIAGIVSALRNNINYVGVAPKSKLYIGKTLNDNGKGNPKNLIKGIKWAIKNKVNVLSLSLAFDDNIKEVEDAIDKAIENEIIVVCAAGKLVSEIQFPGKYDPVITVGISLGDEVAKISPQGKELDILAPGISVKSTEPYGEGVRSGTSMAAPFVSGVIALYLAKYKKELKGKKNIHSFIKNKLRGTASQKTEPNPNIYYGHGIIDPIKFILSQP